MSIFSKIGKFAAAVFAGLMMTAMAADDIYPPLDTDLNDFDPTVPVGRYIQQISSNTVNEVVILTNGVLTVGGESINIAEETNEVYKSAVAYVDGATNEIGSIIRPLQVIPELIPDHTSPSNQLADKAWVDKKVESVAAYYITADAEGNAFESYAALANTTVYYSGGVVRVPTRNDYAVVLVDETHGGTEWRYIYAVPDGATSGQWEAQYPIETNDYEALSNKPEINGHTLTNNQTGADLGLLDLAGGTMTGPLSTPRVDITRFGYPTWSIELHADAGDFHIKAPPMGEGSEGLGSVSVFLPRKRGKNISGVLALAAPNPTAGHLAALDADGNPTDSGLSTTNMVTLAYDVNSNRTAVTVGVPRQNDPSSEVDTSAVDEATGRYITVPEVVGPHSLAITGGEDEESDPSERTVASGEGAIAANKGVATNRFSVALGSHTFAAGEAAVSHGYETAALGSHSHSEGWSSYAHGTSSHAEGESTFAFGYAAHAEGYGSEAHGDYSHAEGYGSEAHGAYSHAAGFDSQTTAEAWYAHSDGIGARATNHTAYVWQGATGSLTGTSNPMPTVRGLYYSHGLGTYNINPNGGLAGFWVGETNLAQHIDVAVADRLASTSAAPAWVSGKSYTPNALVTYNGLVYCNTMGGTFVSDIPPSSDTNWGVEPVSDLFLPLNLQSGATIITLPYDDHVKSSLEIKDSKYPPAIKLFSQDDDDQYIMEIARTDIEFDSLSAINISSERLVFPNVLTAGGHWASLDDLMKLKQDLLPYPTNAIPQSAVSELETDLDFKLDKSGNGFTVSHTENGLRIADNAGVYHVDVAPNGVFTDYPDEQPHFVAWPKSGGTLALTSDIDAAALAATNYTDSATKLSPVYDGNGDKYSDWVCDPLLYEGHALSIVWIGSGWIPYADGGFLLPDGEAQGTVDSTSLLFHSGVLSVDITATRTANPIIGYTLNSQTNEVVASTNSTTLTPVYSPYSLTIPSTVDYEDMVPSNEVSLVYDSGLDKYALALGGTRVSNYLAPTNEGHSLLYAGGFSRGEMLFGLTDGMVVAEQDLWGYVLGSQDDKPVQAAGKSLLKTEFAAWTNGTGLAIGRDATASSNGGVALGRRAKAGNKAIAISSSDGAANTTASGTYSVAVGHHPSATAENAIAIGRQAKATAKNAAQIGYSATANDVEGSLRYMDTVLVDGNGKIPSANLDIAVATADALDSKVAGERCTTSGTWCVNDGIMGTDIIFSTGAFSESATPNNNINNGSYITFNPSYFGMSNYETIQKFTVRARSNSGGGWPGNFVGYARILNAADLNTVLAVSEQFTVSNFNQIVEIGLKPHVLLDTNNTYMIQFVTSLDSQTLAENIPLRLVTGSTSPLCYVNGNTSWKPIMTVDHFMSISGQMQAIVAALQSGNFNTIQGIADTMTAMSASVGVSASQQSPNRFASSSSSTGSGSTTLRVGTNADLQGN